MKWHSSSSREVLEALNTDENKGLDEKEVMLRQKEYGYNKLAEKKKTPLIIKFLQQFNDFMIIILLAAAVMSFVVSYIHGDSDIIDPIIILLIVTLNAILGLVQENKAEKSIEALQKMASPTAKTLRNGSLQHIEAAELVPGDIILLETGDLVPADARIISSSNLKAEESALTGESVPVEKDELFKGEYNASIGDRRNMLFASSTICYGRGKAVVTETGMNSEMGKIAHMIMEDESPQTPLQKKLDHTGKTLGIAALAICVVIFFMGIIRQVPPFEMFMTSVSLAVAAIPEGLPAIVTIMLAIGVQRMAKQKAILRKLPAVETLGSASVICSDKTGTLTQNKMTVVNIFCSSMPKTEIRSAEKRILTYASLCNDTIYQTEGRSIKLIGDPTETALVAAAAELDIDKNDIESKYPRVKEVPFDSSRKLMSTVHKCDDGRYLVITKGAPDFLLKKCTHIEENREVLRLTEDKIKELGRQNFKMAGDALRVLAVSYKYISSIPSKVDAATIEHDLVFMGLVGMMDPPREEVRDAVATCREAGIKAVMVTGDHVVTATAIAKKLGIMAHHESAITGEELSNMSQEELSKNIYNYSVFARVSPEHKVRIVKAFQSRGDVVAMTGDGVNDAPALKAADIGCAMGITGTDVAKGVADMVLADDNFSTIVEAVKEGRGIYSNIKKAAHFLLSSNIGEIITIFVAMLLGWQTPLLAIHLLWVNLVTDSLPAIALGVDPPDKYVMCKKPFNNKKSLFSDGLWQKIILEGLMIGMLAILAFGVGSVYFDKGESHVYGQTMAFATLSISQLVHAFNMRSEDSIFRINLFENKYLVAAFFVGIILQVSVIMLEPLARVFKVAPLHANQWLIVAGLSIAPILIVELQKYVSRIIQTNFMGVKSYKNSYH